MTGSIALQVITPMTKYALTLTPIVLSLEELMPSSEKMRSNGVSMFLRTILVLSTLVVALAFPFFGKLFSRTLSFSFSNLPLFHLF